MSMARVNQPPNELKTERGDYELVRVISPFFILFG
jgi:hypothetical protein